MGGEVTSTTNASDSSGLPRDFFPKIYARLELQGNYLTPEQKARIELVTTEEYERQNKAELLGMNVGALPANFMVILLSALQKLFSGEAQIAPTIEGFINYIKEALSGATDSGKQYVVNTIAANTNERLRADPSLAGIADLVTGLGKNSYAPDIGGRASIVDQLSDLQNIAAGASGSLNRPTPTEVADNSSGNGLPASVTRPLTPAQRGA